MIAAALPFSSQRLRRRIALFMAVAVLVAGIAQAGHFHKLEAGTHSDVHLQCLLCLYSTGSAGAPDVVRLVQGATAHRCPTVAVVSSIATDAAVASYDARGPPLA
jgi:hypothetical protein